MLWIVLAVSSAFGVIGSLFMLRDSAKRLQPSEEALQRMRERNVALALQEKDEDSE